VLLYSSECYFEDRKTELNLKTGREGPDGEYIYTSSHCLTSALDGVGGQRHSPAALPPRE
jgi:hypothetical protein